MPFPVEMGTHLLLRPNNKGMLRFFSLNFPDKVHQIPLSEKYTKKADLWINYPLGAIQQLNEKTSLPSIGMDFLFSGNIPAGAGMSSSASIEVATLFALNEYFNLSLELIDIVILAQKAENEFVGVSCGIMDQYAVSFGEVGHMLFLECDKPRHRFVKAQIDGYGFLVVNTGKKRGLAESKYNERYQQCQNALSRIREIIYIDNLCDLNIHDLAAAENLLSDDSVLQQRLRHVVSEKHRVLKAEKALMDGDLISLGQLMNESHLSLKNDYEVTGFELDTMVEILQDLPVVLGARMTGAGFGGCCICLVKNNIQNQCIDEVCAAYTKKTGFTPEFYPVTPSEGVHLTCC